MLVKKRNPADLSHPYDVSAFTFSIHVSTEVTPSVSRLTLDENYFYSFTSSDLVVVQTLERTLIKTWFSQSAQSILSPFFQSYIYDISESQPVVSVLDDNMQLFSV